MSQRELGEAARAKVERILSDVIGYTSGSFEFEDGVLPKGAVDLKLSTERVFMTAVRRITDRSFVLRHLEGLDVVLTPTPALQSRLPEFQVEAGGLPERLDGTRTLKDAAEMTRLEDFEAAKIACALLFLGYVSRASEPAAAPADAFDELDLSQTVRLALEDQRDTAEADVTAVLPRPEGVDPTVMMAAPEFPTFVESPAPPPTVIVPAAPPAPPPSPSAPAASSASNTPPPAWLASPPTAEAEEPEPPEPEAPSIAFAAEPASPPRSAARPFAAGSLAAAEEDGHEIAIVPPAPRREEPPAPRMPEATAPRPAEPPVPAAPAPPPRRSEPPATESPGARPNAADLAALDTLLGNRAPEGPLAPFEKPPRAAWQPTFGRTASRGAKTARGGGSRAPLLIAVGVVAVAAMGGGVWYALRPSSAPRSAAADVRASASPTPAASVAPVAPATPSPSAAAATGPGVAAAGASPSGNAAAPAQTPPVTVPPATTPPRPAAPAGAAERSDLADARRLLRRGELAGAARGFTAHLRRAPANARTIQILVACSADTVQKAVANVAADELYIVPVAYKGRSCYRLNWGMYESDARADSALRQVPEYFRKGGATPRVVPVSGILP